MEFSIEQSTHEAADVLRLQWEDLALQSGFSQGGKYLQNLLVGSMFKEHDGASIRVGAYVAHAFWVEFGHGAFNLAEKIDPSKWHIGKHGNRFIRVPFGHLTGGAKGMPSEVYEAAKTLSPKNPRMTGKMMEERGIAGKELFPGFGVGGRGKNWKSSPYQGMFKTTQTTAKASSSKYSTIRTITPESTWIIPPMAGKFLRQKAVATSTPMILEVFKHPMIEQIHVFVNTELKAQFSKQ